MHKCYKTGVDPRVVITGIGVVSPFGVGRERFWEAISTGQSGARVLDELDSDSYACRVAAPVVGVTIDDVPSLEGDDIWDTDYRADPKRYSRAALIAVIAAREAWNDAGLRVGEPNAGVVIGSGGGGIDVGERQYLRLLRRTRQEGDALRHPHIYRRHDVERESPSLSDSAASATCFHAVVPVRPMRWGTPPGSSAPAMLMWSSRAAPTPASRQA